MNRDRITLCRQNSANTYARFDRIDGSHPLKQVERSCVEYRVRTRQGGQVYYFNFDLAREMGLIPKNHPDVLTTGLKEKILYTFSLVIINEYDEQNQISYPEKDIRPHTYMATRYLQLQHPNKRGKTSGDGRGIWNGQVSHNGTTWDVISSGTGATCLSPAHAQTGQFFKTGDKQVGYGNGYNCVSDGLSAALMSEVFHKKGIGTERTLAILAFEGGSAINVRVGKNLLRPAHFFHHLKQGFFPGAKQTLDLFIDRQFKNGDLKTKKYNHVIQDFCERFAKMAACFESEYIFCWLEWDGDNILADGGIIDYGSIRQFGLFHKEYRYDDVDRFSTTIPEQKAKARYIVQTFIQLVDFVKSGQKKPIQYFKQSPLLKKFDFVFDQELKRRLLVKLGIPAAHAVKLTTKHPEWMTSLLKLHQYFEHTAAKRGKYKIHDGITQDAVFSMADLHRALPSLLSLPEPYHFQHVIETMRSSYASKKDVRLYPSRTQKLRALLDHVKKFYTAAYGKNWVKDRSNFQALEKRIIQANHRERITGDAVLQMTTSLIRQQRSLGVRHKAVFVRTLVSHQSLLELPRLRSQRLRRLVENSIKALRTLREGF